MDKNYNVKYDENDVNGRKVIVAPLSGHGVEQCDINDRENVKPADDCGHTVNEGPGTVKMADLNEYTEDYGKKAVIAGGAPKHNLDQDVENGPGVE